MKKKENEMRGKVKVINGGQNPPKIYIDIVRITTEKIIKDMKIPEDIRVDNLKIWDKPEP